MKALKTPRIYVGKRPIGPYEVPGVDARVVGLVPIADDAAPPLLAAFAEGRNWSAGTIVLPIADDPRFPPGLPLAAAIATLPPSLAKFMPPATDTRGSVTRIADEAPLPLRRILAVLLAVTQASPAHVLVAGPLDDLPRPLRHALRGLFADAAARGATVLVIDPSIAALDALGAALAVVDDRGVIAPEIVAPWRKSCEEAGISPLSAPLLLRAAQAAMHPAQPAPPTPAPEAPATPPEEPLDAPQAEEPPVETVVTETLEPAVSRDASVSEFAGGSGPAVSRDASVGEFAGVRERTGPGGSGPAASRDASVGEFAGVRERTGPGGSGPAVSRDASVGEFAGVRERTGPAPNPFRTTLITLLRSPRTLFAVVPWFFFAALTRQAGPAGATVPLVLLGRIAVPVVVFAAFRTHLADLDEQAQRWVPLGVPKRTAAASQLAALAAATGAPLAILGGLLAVRFHGADDPAPTGDALFAAGLLALEALVYLSLFGAAASFRKGKPAFAVFIADLFLGGLPVLQFLSPRAHAASLLGAANVLGLPARGSSVALVVLGLAASTALHRRFKR